jgi:predicted nucleic acid-binding protein
MMKRQRLRLTDATKALELSAAIPLRFVDVDLAEALRLSARLDIYAYDADVIRCARSQRAPLLTLERRLLNAARAAAAEWHFAAGTARNSSCARKRRWTRRSTCPGSI